MITAEEVRKTMKIETEEEMKRVGYSIVDEVLKLIEGRIKESMKKSGENHIIIPIEKTVKNRYKVEGGKIDIFDAILDKIELDLSKNGFSVDDCDEESIEWAIVW